MNSAEILALARDTLMTNYAPPALALARGRGARVWDADGREYLDFLSGIAVNSLGHAHPRLVRAVREQAGRLMHTSNLYAHEFAPRLARALLDRSFGRGRCFFCNSGAEANEALIKLARLWGSTRGGRYEVVTMRNSFHGRTLATLTATGQAKVQTGFEPLPAGFAYADFNELASVRAALTDKTAAVLVEAVQGEGGVRPAAPAFLQGLRALCDERGILMMCDEVQCGLGRTGTWFGFQQAGVRPDAFSLAKGLGGGLPIGAVVAGPALADVFQPGHHGSTFGGNPVACAAALAVIEVLEEDGLVGKAAELGDLLMGGLRKLAKKHAFLQDVRGQGLIVGLALDRPAKDLEIRLRERGLLALATANTVIRFLPPMIVTPAQVRKAVGIVAAACADFAPANPAPQAG